MNLGTVRDCIEGPLQKGEVDLRVCNIHINGMWELHKISFILPWVLSQSIKATPIRTASASEDHLSWIASPRGDFNPKSAYLIACGATSSEVCFQGAWIWKLKTLPKIQMFLWKCYHHSIPIKAVLAQKGIQMPPCCDICRDKPETASHVLRECTAAQVFWAESNMLDEMHNTMTLDIVDWIKVNAWCKVFAKGKNYSWAHYFLFGLWQLWLSRNKRLFQPLQHTWNLTKSMEAQVYEFCYCVLDHGNPRLTSTVAVG